MNIISKVALNEYKLILRSLVFRLFAMFLLAAQLGTVLFLYVTPIFDTWGLRAVPSAIPYTATLIYQLFTSLGAVFIATECLDRDLFLNTTDSIYSRNFAAPWYMLGKGLGIMMAMLMLMFIQLLIPFIVNMFFLPDTPTPFASYLIYPFIITVPALLFIIGLSWLVMLNARSQAITFMVMVIMFGVTFWANRITVLHNLFDYPGLRIPALYSDFIGFGDAGRLFMHRGMFALLGMGFMAGAPLLLPRLPQNQRTRQRFAGVSIVLCIASALLAISYIGAYAHDRSIRDDLRALNHEFGSHPRATMTACDLSIEHRGNTIEAEAAIGIRNDTDEPLDTYLFSLNPDLEVHSVNGQGVSIPFERNRHLVTVIPSKSLAPGDTDSLVIAYSGTITDRICYLDTPEPERTDNFNVVFMPVQRMSGIITRDCVLLTPETLWYPVAGVPYGSTFPDLGRKDFPRFTLTVDTEPGMIPVSQGLPEILPDGRTTFRPETPLSQLSLNIARYQHQATEVDSVTYAVYVLQGHDFYSSLMEIYMKGLPEYIRWVAERYESRYFSSYPFDYFTFIETPIQFSPRQRIWTIVQDNLQPGIIQVNERGTFLWDQLTLVRYNNSNYDPDEMMMDVFSSMLGSFFGESYKYYDDGSIPPPIFSKSSLHWYIRATDDIVFNIFPNYYSFTNNYHSEQWPIIDTMLERFLALQYRTSGRITNSAYSLRPTDTANLLLAQHSIADILSSSDQTAIINFLITVKLNQLFGTFTARIGAEVFNERFKSELASSRFTSASFSSLLDAVQEGTANDTESFLNDWYYSTELPICKVSDIKQLEIHKNERIYYQLMVTLSNPSSANGLFQLSCMTVYIDEQTDTIRTENYERFVEVPVGEARCVCLVGDDPFYRKIDFHSFVSQNLPAMFSVPIPEPETGLTVALHDTVLTVEPIDQPENPNVIVVDDTTPGCVASSKEKSTWFRKFFRRETGESEYNPVRLYTPDESWVRSIYEEFYGDHIRSGLVKATGSGDQLVTWTATLPESGLYDVYTHIPMNLNGQNRERLHSVGLTGTFLYTIHHDEGMDDVEIKLSDYSEKWIYLGSYYFSAGEASVVLSDESDGRIVFADAIKWVKK